VHIQREESKEPDQSEQPLQSEFSNVQLNNPEPGVPQNDQLPEDEKALIERGSESIAQGELNGAIPFFLKAIELNAECVEAYNCQGYINFIHSTCHHHHINQRIDIGRIHLHSLFKQEITILFII